MALDLATKLGWACGLHAERPRFGSHTLPSTGEDIGLFIAAYDDWLNAFVAVEQPDLLAFEAPILPRVTQPATARKLMGLASHTEFVCIRRAVICREGHIQQVKKFWAGSGRSDKAEMMTAARRYGFDVRNDNEADSLALWALMVHTRFPDQRHRWALGQIGAAA